MTSVLEKVFFVVVLAALFARADITMARADAGPKAQQVHAIVIDDDPGGQVNDHIRWYGRVRDSGVPVILRGMCVSACTFILTLPKTQVCVEPTATLGFHWASSDGKPAPDTTQALIARYYPIAVQKWIAARTLGDEPIYMFAPEIVSLGIFSACPEAPTL
jgi:hypothetical protein